MKGITFGLLAVVASAVMLLLALPPADLHPLGFVALVPVFLVVRGKGFAAGFIAGISVILIGAFLARSGMFYQPSILDGDPGWTFAGFTLFGLAVSMTAAVVGEIKKNDKWTPWLIAAWAVIFEACLLFYLPAHMALTQYRQFPAMKIATVGGIWAVSYFVWVINLQIAYNLKEKKKWSLAACGIVVVLYLGLGATSGFPEKGALTVAAIQTESLDLDELAELNRQATEAGAEIVVWPELSGMNIAFNGDTTPLIELAAQDEQSPFVTSFEDNASPLPYNVAAVFDKSGESDWYNKRKLFGGERNIHQAGNTAVRATVGNVTYGINICFDSCFPSVMRDTASLNDVEVLLLPTLDPISPYGFVQAIHSAYTPFRAAELGIPIVRADTSAYSMVVDSRGVIVDELPSGTEEILVTTINAESRPTLYKLFGDWFLYVCLLTGIGGLIVGRRRRDNTGKAD